jgi:malate synthase
MRSNIEVGLIYVYHWLGGLGCVPIHNLMEDAATAEISRTQVWQALHHGITLADGTVVTKAFFDQIFRDVSESVFAALRLSTDKKPTFANAKNLFYDLCVAENLEDFLTLPAYKALITGEYDGKKV